MSIYNNEASKIYPDLNPTAPQGSQTYWLIKLSETEAYFFSQIEVRRQNAKNIKRFNTITGILNTGLITSAVIAGGVSTATFASGVGLPVGAAFGEAGLLLFLATVIIWKFFKTLAVKQNKHDTIKLHA